jgi:uncharacterized protein YbjT (DUF2867 family)
MRLILFGASGMVGQGVLREALQDPAVERVLAVVRSPMDAEHPKLQQLVSGDFFDLSRFHELLRGHDACLYCLGVSAAGLSEPAYRRITYDLTLSVARTLHELNPQLMFVYVSGAGTDETERGSAMWARIKGATENALLSMPFKYAYMFRPGLLIPLHGIRSRTQVYRVLYPLLGPVLPILRRLMPQYVTTTEELGRAMLAVLKVRPDERIIGSTLLRDLAAPRLCARGITARDATAR